MADESSKLTGPELRKHQAELEQKAQEAQTKKQQEYAEKVQAEAAEKVRQVVSQIKHSWHSNVQAAAGMLQVRFVVVADVFLPNPNPNYLAEVLKDIESLEFSHELVRHQDIKPIGVNGQKQPVSSWPDGQMHDVLYTLGKGWMPAGIPTLNMNGGEPRFLIVKW